MPDIKDISLEELEGILLRWKEKRFHARQVWHWIYKRGVRSFAQMSDLSAGLRKRLRENFSWGTLELIGKVQSQDKTEKFLLGLKDRQLIEAVIIPTSRRISACLSSQIGCKFGCKFCASGLEGFRRSLTCAEIISEILFLEDNAPGKRLTHIVFMGTGEPLDNYENVLKAIRVINSPEALGIGARRITISSCGIVPGIRKLAAENLQIELSISLHAADEKTRSRIIPVNNKYPIAELIPACRDYIRETNRQITFEYILIKGINSGLKDALGLSKILKGLNCKVNLIPANPIKECGIEPPDKPEIYSFRDFLFQQKMNVTLRRPRGQDIQAACGQLRLRYEKG